MEVSDFPIPFEFIDFVSVKRNMNGEVITKDPLERSNLDQSNLVNFGEGPFCKFEVDTEDYENESGVYLFAVDSEIKYFGNASNIHARIQPQIGNISESQYTENGNLTYCRINHKIWQAARKDKPISLWATTDNYSKDEIVTEYESIKGHSPPWAEQS